MMLCHHGNRGHCDECAQTNRMLRLDERETRTAAEDAELDELLARDPR